VFAILAASGCAVRRTTTVAPSLAPAMEASADDLVARVNAFEDSIGTLTATVEFEPTAGSVYSGVIKEYHDVKGFILIKRPALIRVIGQAPVIRTNIFDMVSDGETFRLSIPPKHKFVVGSTALTRPAKNPLENMRPQHFLDALLIPRLEQTQERFSYEEADEGNRKYYVLSIFEPTNAGPMFPERKIWFERSNLEIARLQLYGPQCSYVEDVHYSDYQDFQGTRYPARMQIARPIDDYAMVITIQKATFNQEITPDKFQLKKPANAELVELGQSAQPEGGHGE
jgi:outer membrane lipoprotein-sorting protein